MSLDAEYNATLRAYESKSFEARLSARQIQRELVYLRGSLDVIKSLHTLQTWDSPAAQKSRQLLSSYHTFHLNSLIGKLEAIVEQLNIYSYIWRNEAEKIAALIRVSAY